MNCWNAKIMKMIKPISSQAMGSTKSTMEGSETRKLSSASNKISHERPAPHRGEEIVRSSEKTRRTGLNSLEGTNDSNPPKRMGPCRVSGLVNGLNRMNCWKAKAEAMLIGSQVANGSVRTVRVAKGSETRDRAKAVISPRASCPLKKGEEIVRHSSESWRSRLNSVYNIWFLNPKTKADLVKTFFPKERTQPGMLEGGAIGLDVQKIVTPAGTVRFEDDVFIDDGGAPNAAAIGDVTKRPADPTPGAVTTPADALSKFTADDAGSYFYTAVAVNRYGRSGPVDVVAGPTAVSGIVAGDKVTFTLTPGSAVSVDWYEVFRTKKDGATGTERLILRVPSAGAGATTINDFNGKLPGTTSAYLFQMNLENMAFKQLAPMVKIPLATIDSSIRWMQLIYGVPTLYTPGKNVLYTNVGRASGFVGQP